MSAEFDNLGVRFLYPENWRLEVEEAEQWPRRITLETPEGGFWSLAIYHPPEDPARLAETTLDAMRQEYPELESSAAEDLVAGVAILGYDMSFFCLDLMVESRVRAFQLGDKAYVMMGQAENRTFDFQGPVFAAITQNLLDNLTNPPR